MTVVNTTPVTTVLAFRKQDVDIICYENVEEDGRTDCLPDLGSNTAASSLLTHYVCTVQSSAEVRLLARDVVLRILSGNSARRSVAIYCRSTSFYTN